MKHMQTADQLVTRSILEEVLATFGRRQADYIIEAVRDEFDSKLGATENRLKNYLPGEMDEQTQILLQAMADMVEPMQQKDDELDRRVSALESKVG